jgi:glucose/mannose-6-phosphate isomerase
MPIDAGSLDDPAALAAGDPGGMLGLVARTGPQLRVGFELGCGAADLPSADGLRAIAVCGMGGSGVVGDVVRALFGTRSPVPVVVHKGFALPESLRRDALVLAVSFSGNTEETLAAYGQAVAAGCRVVAFSAGGELAARAEADEVPHIRIPHDVPMPRVGLGYQAGAAIGVLAAIGLVPAMADDLARTAGRLEELAGSLAPERPSSANEAKRIAAWLGDRTPIVWSTEGLAEAAGLRWKTQLNENAKVPAVHATFPELDHNEIEGWSAGTGASFALVVLRHRFEDHRVAGRVPATLEAVAPSDLIHREVRVDAASALEALFSLIVLGDFVATYLAIARGVDPLPIPVLSGLKERLRR